MTFEKALYDILYIVIIAVIPYLLKVVCGLLNAKADDSRYANAVKAITAAVLNVNQTYVESLKKAGSFTPEAQEEARQKAIEFAIESMSAETVKYLDKVCGSAEEWCRKQLEAVIASLKRGD
nr:MAG TPA: holin [Caudoviricetes sp.]